jgi:predicted CoA-substrate-specific enzyme activase
MLVVGIDIGSRAAKAVSMKDDKILASTIRDTGADSIKTSYILLKDVLKDTGYALSDVQYTVATGYGRVLVPFANENISEISCHARGINWYFPTVRTILDMGGQDCKAINCDEKGQVTNFVMNDKCAGGTGRFLEMIGEVLEVPLEKIGDTSLQSKNFIPFNTICAVFAKSEAIIQLRKGVAKSDILAGLHDAIANRSYNLMKRISIEKDFSISGGISKNKGMVQKITEKIGIEPLLCEDPQLAGAIGAAIFAREHFTGAERKAMKIHYGYSDGSGDYFITVDNELCDGCGKCVPVCPENILELGKTEDGKTRAIVSEKARKRISYLCPGFSKCGQQHENNCHSVCHKNAISHSW